MYDNYQFLGQAIVHGFVKVCALGFFFFFFNKARNYLNSKIQFSMVPMLERELVSEGADSTNYSFATLKPAEFERVLIALIYFAYLV